MIEENPLFMEHEELTEDDWDRIEELSRPLVDNTRPISAPWGIIVPAIMVTIAVLFSLAFG